LDLTILIGIVSSVIAFAGILVSSYLIYIDSREFKTISKGRKKALNGSWKGNIEHLEEINGLHASGTLEISFVAKRKKIRGELLINHAAGEFKRKDRMKFTGGFKMDRFLELNFQNANDEVVQFGNMIMELDPMGDKMEGKIHGFGPLSRKVLSGNVYLNKIK